MSAVRATIVVPSFNHAAWVVEAVQSALAQTERDIEVLVIDDGSTDDSLARLAALSDPRLEVVAQSNAGLSTTLNRGLDRARGRWIKFLPSDDVLEPHCLARQLAAADAVPGARLVFALPTVVDANGAPFPDPAPQAWFDHTPDGRDAILRDLIERNFLCAPAVIFDRDLARLVGGFDAALRIAQDYDLWMKMLPWAPAASVRERLVRVRWHGANQSGVVTRESEAERACVVRGALERFGIERWIELFRARVADGSSAAARLALADALVRSGLHDLAPLATRLRTAHVDGADGGALRRLARRAARVLRRSAVPQIPAAPSSALPRGPRAEHWIVVATRPESAMRARTIAQALAANGVAVTLAAPAADAAAMTGVRTVPCDLATLRTLPGTRDERVRLVVQEPDAAVIAFAREARLAGVRVLYDKAEGAVPLTRAAIDSERALIDAADDLVGSSRSGVKQLAVARRLVHLLPDTQDEAGAGQRARALRAIADRPTVVVAVACARAHDVDDVMACLAQLEASRGALPYRIVAVDDGVTDGVLDVLARRDEAGELQLVRNALRGRASGRNLALRATASELVVLMDADRLAPGPGWLDEAVAALLRDAGVGAIVERGRGGGNGWAWLAPRRLLQQLGGFDDVHDPAGLEDADQEQQLAAVGQRLVDWATLGPAPVLCAGHGVGDAAVDARARARRRFAERWPDAPLPHDWARITEQV
jgi:glycosyltransferase involved in cell wall biosynthesis